MNSSENRGGMRIEQRLTRFVRDCCSCEVWSNKPLPAALYCRASSRSRAAPIIIRKILESLKCGRSGEQALRLWQGQQWWDIALAMGAGFASEEETDPVNVVGG